MDLNQNVPDKLHRSSRTRTLHSRDSMRNQDHGPQNIPVWDVLDEKTGDGTADYSDWEKGFFFTCEEDSDMGFIFETARNSPCSSDIENDQCDEYEEKDSILGENLSCFSYINHLDENKTNISLKREFTDEFADANSSDFNLLLNQNDPFSAGQREAWHMKLNDNQDDENNNCDNDGDESSNATEILYERFKEIDYDFNDPGYHSPSSLSYSCGSEECIYHDRSPHGKSPSSSSLSSDTQNRNQNQRQNQSGGNRKPVAPTPEEITRFWTSPSLPEPFQLSEMIIKLLRESECL